MITTYQDILKGQFDHRVSKNPNYSLRSYARDLKIAASTLSEVLKKKKGLSPKKAQELLTYLRIPNWKKHFFLSLVETEYANKRSKEVHSSLELPMAAQTPELKESALLALTSPHDLAILESLSLPDFKADSQWIAQRLGIEIGKVDQALERLITTGLIAIDDKGHWSDASEFFTSTDGITSTHIQNYHRETMSLMAKKLQEDITRRCMKSVIFTISKDKTSEVEKILDEAMTKILNLSYEENDSVNGEKEIINFSSFFFKVRGQHE